MNNAFERQLSPHEWRYFDGQQYHNDALEFFGEVVNTFIFASYESCFISKKSLLELQLSFVDNQELKGTGVWVS